MYTAILGILLFFWSSSGFAVVPQPTSQALPKSVIPTQFSLDILEQRLKGLENSAKAKKSIFFKAGRALKEKRWKELDHFSSLWIQQGKLPDVGFWLRAQGKKGLAHQALIHHRVAEGLRLAQESEQALIHIFKAYPYSPYMRTLARELGEVELLQGNALFRLKKIQSSQVAFESAFQRLQTQNLLGSIDPSSLEHYSSSCSQHESPLCRFWAEKWVRVFSKKSNEVQILGRSFKDLLEPTIEGKKVPLSFSRMTATYKATDLDAVAYQDSMQYYWKRKYSKAAQSFSQFLDEFPKSSLKARALYWLARSLEKQGDSTEAARVFERVRRSFGLSFQGILSSLRTQKSIDELASALIPLGSEQDSSLTPLESLSLKRALDLLAADARTLAAQELKELKPRDSFSHSFLLYLMLLQSHVGNSLQAFQIISELIQRGVPEVYTSYVIRRVFPVIHLDPIETYSSLHGLDPLLVLSLIKQESSFDAEATSWVGALGLMQLMPGTAVDTDAQVIQSQLFKSQENIRVGTLYLKKLLDRYSGNTILALAAYNAGPSAVDRWLKNSPHQDLEEFIEYIPYKETRDYVGSIIRNYFWYSHYLKGSFPSGVEMFWNESLPLKSKS